MGTNIHPSAVVHENAQLGVDVEIGPFSVIEDNVVIGDGSRIDSHSQVLQHTTMGKGNHVYSFASVGGVPQDLKYQGEVSQLVLGDGNTIREYVSLHRGTANGGGVTKIGNQCLIMGYVHVAHDCLLGDGVIMSNGAMLAGHVTIEDNAVIGGMSGIHQFVRIGAHSFLGAYSGLAQDLPPFMLAAGSRAKLHGPNMIGIRRHGFGADVLGALRSAFKTIWRSDIPRQEALENVEKEFGDIDPVLKMVEFIRNSERGVISAEAKNGDEE